MLLREITLPVFVAEPIHSDSTTALNGTIEDAANERLRKYIRVQRLDVTW
jgi:hypothetical protein